MKKKLVLLVSAIFFLQWILFASDYSQEYKDAYNYAYSQWITTVKSIDKARMYSPLDRISMAKMISNFAINVLWLELDKSIDCSFTDVSPELDAQYGYWATKACQLWLMWIWNNWKKSTTFSPKWVVKRWQWATVFSRALSKFNWDIVEEGSPYYKAHLDYLYSKWIIKDVEKPSAKSNEKRWNVMLMMYRVSKNVSKNYEESNLVGGFEINPLDETEQVVESTNDEKIEDNLLDDIQDVDDSDIVDVEKVKDSQIESSEDGASEFTYHRVNNSYDQFSIDDFNAVEDVYHNIRAWDRVIFLVRHSERITNCTSEWWLTDHWIELAKWVWAKLQWAPFEDTSTDFYWSSIVKRTVQTSYYVGESRGSKVLKDVLDDDAWSDYRFVNHSSDIDSVVYGNYFSDGNSYSSIEHLYEENRDVVETRALRSIEKVCSLTEGHPFSWITSHDWFTLPITEWATNENLTFSQSKYQWPNFMQWVAIIVHEDWWWEIYPVRSLESGRMNTWENPWC